MNATNGTTTFCLGSFLERTGNAALPRSVRAAGRLLAQLCLQSGALAATTESNSQDLWMKIV